MSDTNKIKDTATQGLTSLLRHALNGVGASLATVGVTAEQWETTLAGAVAIVVAFVWSLVEKKFFKKDEPKA
jgi:hypothetical protein